MELWRSIPVDVVGWEYVQIAPGPTVMQLLSARTWDMPVELLSHLSLLSILRPTELLLVNFMLPTVHPELGIHVILVSAHSRMSLQTQVVPQISLLLSDAVSYTDTDGHMKMPFHSIVLLQVMSHLGQFVCLVGMILERG